MIRYKNNCWKPKGQLGNQLFQYVAGKILADVTGMALQVPPYWMDYQGRPLQWADKPLFTLEDSPGLNCEGKVAIIHEYEDMLDLANSPSPALLYGWFEKYPFIKQYQDKIRSDWLKLPRYKEVDPNELVIHLRRADATAFRTSAGATAAIPISAFERAIEAFVDFRSIRVITDDPDDEMVLAFADKYDACIQSGRFDEDFLAMASAENLIISQSTFSWWAGYLGRASKIVCPLPMNSWWQTEHYKSLIVDDDPRFSFISLPDLYAPTDVSFDELKRSYQLRRGRDGRTASGRLNIVYCSESGSGLGHAIPLAELSKAVVQVSDKVEVNGFAAVHDLSVASIFEALDMAVLPAPKKVSTEPGSFRSERNYLDILINLGFGHHQSLTTVVKAWLGIFKGVSADRLIIDLSPGALLASRIYRHQRSVKVATFSSPFATPPLSSRLPGFAADVNSKDEMAVLKTVNRVLAKYGLDGVATISSLFWDVDLIGVKSYEAFDGFPRAHPVEYLGAMPNREAIKPVWPKGDGLKIFGYIRPFTGIEAVLESLSKGPYRSLLYLKDVKSDLIDKYASDHLKVMKEPVDIKAASQTCDLAILQGANTQQQMALEGVPLLLLPRQAEQMIMAKAATRSGLAKYLPNSEIAQFQQLLDETINDDELRERCQHFSQRVRKACSVEESLRRFALKVVES